MTSVMLTCDFSKQFSDTFSRVLDEAAAQKSFVNIFHVIDLPIAINEKQLPVSCVERGVLKFLREQAEREFALLNKRLNRMAVPVSFEVSFAAERNERRHERTVL